MCMNLRTGEGGATMQRVVEGRVVPERTAAAKPVAVAVAVVLVVAVAV